jgi:hypothetical protein
MAMGNLPPFEDMGTYGGFFPALLQTWVSACFRPTEFFKLVGNSHDLIPALLFGVLIVCISFVIEEMGKLVFRTPILMIRKEKIVRFLGVGVVSSVWFGLLLGWLSVLLEVFIFGVIVHLFLILFGGANQGLTVTLRVIAYSHAPEIFAVIPFVGNNITTIWSTVLKIIGLAAAHRTDIWRAVLAVLARTLCFYVCVYVIGTVVKRQRRL